MVLSDSKEQEDSDNLEQKMDDVQEPVAAVGAQEENQLEPGYRFYPTDEEIVIHYLQKKIDIRGFRCRAVTEIDLYSSEPWQLPDKASMGEQEWFFFTKRVPKYPTGTRSNRSTQEGYWKATGRDKEIHSKGVLVGMKKTLVFHVGRAPGGKKTNWIMHEYRLHDSDVKEWVVCRVSDKSTAKVQSPEHIPLASEVSSTTALTDTDSQDSKRTRTEAVSKRSSMFGNESFMPSYINSTVGSNGINYNFMNNNSYGILDNNSWAAGPKPVGNSTPLLISSDSNLRLGGLYQGVVQHDGRKVYNQPQMNSSETPVQHPYQGQYQFGNPPSHMFRADPHYMQNQQLSRTSSVPNLRANPDYTPIRAPLTPSGNRNIDLNFMQLPREYKVTDFSNNFLQNWRPPQQ